MGLLGADVDGLGVFVADAHAHADVGRRDAQIAVSEPSHQVKRLARWLLASQPQAVVGDRLLHRRADLRGRLEEAVGGYEAADALVRALEVVGVDEEAEPALQVGVVREDRLRQKLVPGRLPKALDLAERHRMLRPTLDVRDALVAQQPFEGRLPAPRRVLASVVRQDLARPPEAAQAAFERLDHQRRLLVVGQRPSHDEARVVVHEAGQVHALVPAQQEREDVGLPHLVRSRPLEAPRRLRPSRSGGRRGLDQALFVQDSAHRRLRDAQALEAGDQVSDAAGSCAGARLLRLDDRPPSRVGLLPGRRLAP